MPTAGRKPKEGPKLGHSPSLGHEWVQVQNRPFAGKRPALPANRTVTDREGATRVVKLHQLTKDWWRDVSTMPHCVLWSPTDWRFAIETALIADMMFQGDRAAGSELRLRERIIGTTIDARRDLRIRYVTPEDVAPAPARRAAKKPASKVTSIEDRRKRLLGDAG